MLISEVVGNKPLAKPEQVVACEVNDKVSAAVARMAEQNVGAVVVCSEGNVVGIFTERDLLRGLHKTGAEFLNQGLGTGMVTKVIVVGPDQTVDEALELMNENRIRHLPVVDKDRLIDVLSIRDLIVQKLKRVKSTAEFLQQQVQLGSKPLPM